jgi:hypothetical protein
MPVAVELNGLLPGRGPRGGPGRAPGRGEPPDGLPGACGAGPGLRPVLAGVGAGGAAGCGRLTAGADGSTVTGSATAGAAGGAGGAGATGAAGAAAAGDGAGAAAAGAAAAVPWARAGADGLAETGVTAGRPSRCPLVAAAGTGPRWDGGCGAAGRLDAADAEEADAPAARPDCGLNDSLSLRTTGASIVDDAERTNSPISVSLAITALLSTPISFASS